MTGSTAKQIFDRAQLPNDVLVRIWNLADTEFRGALSVTEFIIAMHLLASYRTGALRALPQNLPAGLYEAAARRGAPPRQASGSRPTSDMPSISPVPRQFSGGAPQRTSSPLARAPYTAPQTAQQPSGMQSRPPLEWAISPQEKLQFDALFAKVDVDNRGYVTGDQAVGFFSNSKLPEEDLAQIWDLADINSEGQLNREEFAVAMYLIRQQLNQRNLAKKTPLPQSLPPSLVPPSMRRQISTPSSPMAAAGDSASDRAKPKSAAEDLFGLDAFSTPPAQVAHSTGGSTAFTPNTPQAAGSPPQPQPAQQSSVFKPFVPSSSFGQNMMTPHGTGPSRTLQNQGGQQSNSDDLLGDNDPEVSKRLTQETTDLANLSNQVGTLTTQMQQVQSKRVSTQEDLSQVNKQKRDFETRLSQLRSAYEQEARGVRALEDQLAASRSESKKIQQDLAMVQHTHQNLQTEHQQVASALEADQKEIAALKERIRQVNNEISQLKPQLEKMRLDARQQKGLVVINKKQLSTLEADREKIKGELAGASLEMDNATRELEETQRTLEATQRGQTMPSGPAPVTSPTSTASQSMNPFHRRATGTSLDRGLPHTATSPQTVATPNLNAFDSFFGAPISTSSPFAPQEQSPTPHQTLGADNSDLPREAPAFPEPFTKAIDSPAQTGSQTSAIATPPSTSEELPPASALPPPPPQSRQITSSFLPLKDNLPRSESPSSSIGVAPPTSRYGDFSGMDTPTNERQFSENIPNAQATEQLEPLDERATNMFTPAVHGDSAENNTSSTQLPDANKPSEIGTAAANAGYRDFGLSSGPPDIPGAFPTESTPFHTPSTISEYRDTQQTQNQPAVANKLGGVDKVSSADSQPRVLGSDRQDFDSAFESFGNKGKEPDRSGSGFHGGNPDISAPRGAGAEFPPIQEFGADNDSDSSSDRGFEDHFTAASPQKHQRDISHASEATDDSLYGASTESAKDVPSPERLKAERALSNSSQLPTPNAQSSPPTYEQTTSENAVSNELRDTKQFPAEYGGLLPPREPMESPPGSVVQSPNVGDTSAPLFGNPLPKERTVSGDSTSSARMPMPFGASAAPYAYNTVPASSEPPHTQQTQTQFSQVQAPPSQAEAPPSQIHPPPSQAQAPIIPPKNVFDDFDNEFGDLSEAQAADDKIPDNFGPSHQSDFDEFNPTFDSPAPSKAIASSVNQDTNAFHDFESSISGTTQPTSTSRQTAQAAPSNHDWDAMFAGLDGGSGQTNGNVVASPFQAPEGTTGSAFEDLGTREEVGAKPALGRTLTTDHDDPILKRLTGMGYPRDASLAALERFDYNLDKVCSLLDVG